MDSIVIPIAKGPVVGTARPPGSKSITNRALICAAFAEGKSRLSGALDSEDTRVMLASLEKLGLDVSVSDDRTQIEITGISGDQTGFPIHSADLYLANSGTSIRFLTAACAASHGEYRLDGNERMQSRPIADLVDVLRDLGANITYEKNAGCPPVLVKASGLTGQNAKLKGNVSSQYLSALLMAAPLAEHELTISVDGELVSKPYIEITRKVMEAFAAKVDVAGDYEQFVVPAGQRYQAVDYAIEPDASAASYFWAVAAVTGGKVLVEGLNRDALQGDVGFVDCLAEMGCEVVDHPEGLEVIGGKLRGIDVDMNAISDTSQTLAVVALFAEGPTRIRGVAHNRHKETDRIGDLATELRKFGATVDEHEDGMTIHPPVTLQAATVETYDDHRMAMSFAVAGLRVEGVTILNPKCCEKTYPRFFEDFAVLCQ